MSKTRRWLTLVIAATLLLGTLAPTAAIAHRSYLPTDLPDGRPLQSGDPDPGAGAPQFWLELLVLKQILIASMRIRFAAPIEPVRTGTSLAADAPIRVQQVTTE